MAERCTLAPSPCRSVRSNSFNTPGSHSPMRRSRRTHSLPAREKPCIRPPPVISEVCEFGRVDYEYDECDPSGELNKKRCTDMAVQKEMGWFALIAGLFLSLALFGWACFLSISVKAKKQQLW